jgi:hypothetical protein
MRYFWVNQNQTYAAEVRGNFMWSPKTKAKGTPNPFYDSMRTVAPGDIVFSFCDTRIKAVGVATGFAQTAPKPDFGDAGWNWSHEGWFVPVCYATFESPIRPKDHIQALRPFLPAKYSPLQATGNGSQQVYLTEIPEALAHAVISLIGQPYFEALAMLTEFPSSPDEEETTDGEETTDERSTVAVQVSKARRGQGIFRSSVLLVEGRCRVTGVTDPRHLRASHIKPWRDSNNSERLSRWNGLLLSPHVDHLFDQGYISFSIGEQLLIVPEVRANVLDRWGIDAATRVGKFSREQQSFLDYHRANVFKGVGS